MTWADLIHDSRFILPVVLQAVLPGPAGALVGTALANAIGANQTPESVANKLSLGGNINNLVSEFSARHADELRAISSLNTSVLQTERTEIKTTQSFAPMLWGRAVMVYVCGAGFLYAVVFSPLLTGFLHTPFPQPSLAEITAMLALLFGHGLDKFLRH